MMQHSTHISEKGQDAIIMTTPEVLTTQPNITMHGTHLSQEAEEEQRSLAFIEQLLQQEEKSALQSQQEEDTQTKKLLEQFAREEELVNKKKEEQEKRDRELASKLEKDDRAKRQKEEEQRDHKLVMELIEKEKKERQKILDSKVYNCEICFSEYKIESMYTLDECCHRFCFDCLREYFRIKIEDGQVKDISCPNSKCTHKVTYSEVKQVISKKLFEKYEQFLLKQTLEADPYVRWCPKPGCGNAMIGSPNNPMMICGNAKCKFTFCFNCREEWHGDASCAQYQEWKKENSEAEKRFDAWTQKNAKICPNCKAVIEKNGGCNHMTCRSCKHQFCWLCLAKYESNHWEKSTCKQYS